MPLFFQKGPYFSFHLSASFSLVNLPVQGSTLPSAFFASNRKLLF